MEAGAAGDVDVAILAGAEAFRTYMRARKEGVKLDWPKSDDDDRPVRIGDGSWLGHGAVVLPGVTIGRHAVVGAGAVVHRDVPDHGIAAGVPARVVKIMHDEG